MKTSKILAVILAAILMLTLLTATVFADEATGESADVTEEVTGEAPEAPADETEAPAEETEAEDHDHDHDHDHENESTEDEHNHEDEINWVDIIVSASIIVLAVIAFVICYFAIPKFREKVKKFFSDYKSELKKVTWSSKEDVRKNTITVIVIILVLVIVIALLDFIFLSGIDALGKLI